MGRTVKYSPSGASTPECTGTSSSRTICSDGATGTESRSEPAPLAPHQAPLDATGGGDRASALAVPAGARRSLPHAAGDRSLHRTETPRRIPMVGDPVVSRLDRQWLRTVCPTSADEPDRSAGDVRPP